MLKNLQMAYLLTELPYMYLGKSIHFLNLFDEELNYAISFSAEFTRKKFWLIMS